MKDPGLVGRRRRSSLRAGLCAAVAFAFGTLACVSGMLHVAHIEKYGPAGAT